MNKYEDKIELMNYLNVLWKRKWLIMIATFLFTAVTAVVSFLLPSKWEVDAIFEPSKYVIRDEGGIFRENFFSTPQEIADYTNIGGYNNLIATDLSINIKDLSKLKAEKPTITNLVRFSVEEKDVKKARLILNSLLNYLKTAYDQMADVKRERIDSQIKSKQVEISFLEEDIKTFKNKLNIIKQRKQKIEKKINDIRKRINKLEKEQRLILNEKKGGESDILIILLYSNEIQQSSINHTILNELYGNKILEEENINLEIRDKERKKYLIENEIINLNGEKGRIYYSRIIKEPSSSTSPVSTNKLLNILIAAPLGFIIFTMIAYFLEYLEKQKAKSKG